MAVHFCLTGGADFRSLSCETSGTNSYDSLRRRRVFLFEDRRKRSRKALVAEYKLAKGMG